MQATLGGFQLDFGADGKLAQLVFGGAALLSHADYRYPLEDGRVFQPTGWDECFPTIEAHAGFGTLGALIGAAAQTTQHGAEVRSTWRLPALAVERRFRAPCQSGLEVTFAARNTGRQPVPLLWASHALFSFEDLLQVDLPDGQVLTQFGLDGSCRKFFVAASGPVRLQRCGLTLTLATDQPHWGVWYNRGGWPASAPASFGCIGVEATNAAAEVPQGDVLAPGSCFRGRVTLSCELPTSRAAG